MTMTLLEELATYLQTNGAGTLATDLFISYAPPDVCPCVVLIDTGGMTPSVDLPTKEPTFQVFIRSTGYEAGKTKLDTIRTLLHQKRNTTLTTTFYYYIYALAEGGHIGRNEAGQDEFSINFKMLTR